MALDFLKKLTGKDSSKKDLSLSEVENLISRGLSKKQIADYLSKQGYKLADIERSLSQAMAKQGVVSGSAVSQPPSAPEMPDFLGEESGLPALPEMGMPMSKEESEGLPAIPEGLILPPMPGISEPSAKPSQTTELDRDVKSVGDVEELVEAVVEERLAEITEKLDEMDNVKDTVSTEVVSLSSNYKNMELRVGELERSVTEIGESYKKLIDEVRLEMSAMEKAMQKLIPTLASNIRELREIKQKKSSKK